MTLPHKNGSSRPCPCCDGRGTMVRSTDGGGATGGVFNYDAPCEECDGTGQRWTTGITTAGGVTAVIHGSRKLSPEDQATLQKLIEVAAERMGGGS